MKKLKPFDLEAAKNGAPVVTVDGREARIVCFDRSHLGGASLVVLVKDSNGQERIYAYYPKGHYYSDEETPLDLCMAPIKKIGWVNLYRDIDGVVTTGRLIHNTKESSSIISTDGCIGSIKIEWEE